MYFPLILATLTSEIGPSKGISETDNAADAGVGSAETGGFDTGGSGGNKRLIRRMLQKTSSSSHSYHTTTRNTPDEVHAMGLEAVKELNARMDPILRGLGYTKGTVGARMAALGDDPRFKFPNNDAGRAEVIAAMQGKIDFIRTKLPLAFRTLVKGNLVIRRLPLAEEAGAPGAYGGAGSIDGTEPGKIWLNLGNVDRHSRFSVASLAFHEGIPGHVWQGEYANRLPLIRTLLAFNAYSEGWALYAETLGDELGAYEGDPVGQLGYLQSIAFRACRMVVDTGLHAKRWTREEAVRWFSETNGSGLAEVAPEVDRYCSWPGRQSPV